MTTFQFHASSWSSAEGQDLVATVTKKTEEDRIDGWLRSFRKIKWKKSFENRKQSTSRQSHYHSIHGIKYIHPTKLLSIFESARIYHERF